MSGNFQNFDESNLRFETQVRLTIQKGRAKNLVRDVRGPVFTWGTDHTCDMVLGDRQFPDVHSYVCVRDGIVSLRHLGHGPAVTVNGRDVRWGELRDGDRIRTGSYEFRVSIIRVEVTSPKLPPEEVESPEGLGSAAFVGKLDQLPEWWSSVTDMPLDWTAISAQKSMLGGRLGPSGA